MVPPENINDEDDDGWDAERLFKSGHMPEMMRHWYSIRKKYPKEYLIAYRMGDFYEFFYDDAIEVSRLLGLTLTKRGKGKSRHPLAGIPHQATQHFKALVRQGKTVVIVEQLENPEQARKDNRIVKRGVIRILSPGTIVDDNLLDSHEPNFICGITREKAKYGLAFLDISSGEFYVIELTGPDANAMLWSYIARFNPVECVIPERLAKKADLTAQIREITSMVIKEVPSFQFEYESARNTLLKHFKTENLAGFGIEQNPLAISAAGGLLQFIKDSYKRESMDNITRIKKIYASQYMFLDTNTQRNLEILQNQRDGGSYGTLLSIIDDTQTPMGTRLLKRWLVEPLLSKDKIEERLDLVEWFFNNYDLRVSIRKKLRKVGDLARLITRINYSSTVNARNLNSLKYSLISINEIREELTVAQSSEEHFPKLLNNLLEKLKYFHEIIELIDKAIKEDPPTTITEGGIIKEGYNPQVDEYREILTNGKDWIIRLEEREKQKLGIKSGLKIGYNRVLGYFIQITQNTYESIKHKLPENYIRRQTMKGAIRFETPELKDMETKILTAEDNLYSLEYELFQEVRKEIQKYTSEIQESAEAIAQIDILSNFAAISEDYNYTRPNITEDKKILIKEGRHPVVEQLNKFETFVPNDCYMDLEKDQILIITGPNWSGKSTYLRQVALISLLAQVGCYVPATEASIGIIDRIFTRIGASDDLTRGQSTFMLEMNEMAEILNYMTHDSLIIIDEIGRGTGTVDGLCIAQAIVEYLHDFGVKTLFSTHFHHLIHLKLPRIKNYHFKILEKEQSRELIFLRKLTEGGTDKSYGIHVAQMAGLPRWVIDRAFDLMDQLSENNGKDVMNVNKLTDLHPEENLTGESDHKIYIHEIDRLKKEIELKNHELELKENKIKDIRAKMLEEKEELEKRIAELEGKIEKLKREQIKSKTLTDKKTQTGRNNRTNRARIQLALIPPANPGNPEIIKILKRLDVNGLTPIEALNILVDLKKKAEKTK